MSDVVLAVAGAVVFAITTWASLAFGYQVFANMSDGDQDPDVSLDPAFVDVEGHDAPAPAIPFA